MHPSVMQHIIACITTQKYFSINVACSHAVQKTLHPTLAKRPDVMAQSSYMEIHLSSIAVLPYCHTKQITNELALQHHNKLRIFSLCPYRIHTLKHVPPLPPLLVAA